jgi:hypothetical protein
VEEKRKKQLNGKETLTLGVAYQQKEEEKVQQ